MRELQVVTEDIGCALCGATIPKGEEAFTDHPDVDKDELVCSNCDRYETQSSYEAFGLCPHGVADDGDCDVCGGTGGVDRFDDSPWDCPEHEDWVAKVSIGQTSS